MRRLQGQLVAAEGALEVARRKVETRAAGLSYPSNGTTGLWADRERLEYEHAQRRVADLEARLRLLLSEGDDD